MYVLSNSVQYMYVLIHLVCTNFYGICKIFEAHLPHSSAEQQFLIRIILLRRFTLSNTTQLIQCHVWLKRSLILCKHQDYFNGEKTQTCVIIFGIIYNAVILWYEYKYKNFYTIACFFIDFTNKNFLCHFIFSPFIYIFFSWT